MADNEIAGYTVAYDQDEIQFPVYVVAFVAACLFVASYITSRPVLFALAVVPACVTYYNFPLLETGRPRIGAGQYGVFIEGLGLLQWRAIEGIEIVPVVIRGIAHRELQISLRSPLEKALILDWRKRLSLRNAMRLPWKMSNGGVIHISLEVFDHTPDEIYQTFDRMWRFFRKQ